MTLWSYILASARHYGKAHLGLLFGVFLASAILSGSMLVGDSVKASLRHVAELRLGKIRSGMIGGDRWFTERLAREAKAAPMIIATGSASAGNAKARVNAVQVLGVDESFWKLSPASRVHTIGQGDVAVNESLARKLGAKVGDSIVVRMEKPSALSRDAPMSGSTNTDIALRRKVSVILSTDDFGAFQLRASQVGADTVFVGLKDLAGQIEMEGRCNAAMGVEPVKGEATIEDFALKLRRVKTDKSDWELSTDRVFIDDAIAAKLTASGQQGVLTYLVNGISSAGGSTPYSMATATDAFQKEIGNAESGMVITQWLAEDQSLKLGDKVNLRYYVVGIGRELKEQTAEFTVSSILPMTDPRITRDWTPDFPGVSDVDNCRDWDPGFPMDKKAVRDKDEKYWDELKGTPKAFISLAAGQKLWGNRFGNVTSIRFADSGQSEEALRKELADKLRLTDIGLITQDFKAAADAAAKGSVDFGGLFIGLSLFLIAAALVFAALLFMFMVERRASQVGLLMALGWTPSMVRRSLLLEAGVIAFIGSALGLLGGIAYTKAALWGLNGAWGDATAGLPLMFAASPVTLVIAFVASFVVALLTLWWTTRKLFKSVPRELLSNNGMPEPTAKRGGKKALITAAVSVVLAIGLAAAGGKATNAEELVGMFFGSGMMLMVGALALAKHWMNKQGTGQSLARSLGQIGMRNVVRRPGRSLAVLGMMAGGIFLVVAVNAFRLSAGADEAQRDSGTGGFALIGESSLPVYEDLNSKAGRETFGLDDEDVKGTSILPFRVRPGDDASCLNLNRAQNPQLVGVNSAKLATLKAFAFASGGGWADLQAGGDAVPAIADQATAMWGLQKGEGDVIEYDLGGDKKLRVKLVGLLAGSVLQGKLIVDEKAFVDRLPDVPGYRFFLVDTPPGKGEAVRELLTRQLEQRGMALEPAPARLAAFNAVQNTYIGIFTVLGGLGVLLGTAGLGVLVARHVLERRGELGLMQAIGFTPSALRRMVIGEHGALLIGGVLLGAASAVVAVWPSLTQSRQELPLGFVGVLIVAIVLCGLTVCAVAAASALRGRLVDAVRRE